LSSIISSCQSHLLRMNVSLFSPTARRIVKTEKDCLSLKKKKKKCSKHVLKKKRTKTTGKEHYFLLRLGKEQYFLLRLGLAMLTNRMLVGRNQQTRRH